MLNPLLIKTACINYRTGYITFTNDRRSHGAFDVSSEALWSLSVFPAIDIRYGASCSLTCTKGRYESSYKSWQLSGRKTEYLGARRATAGAPSGIMGHARWAAVSVSMLFGSWKP